MKRIREVIIVEGRYDKNTVAQVVDAAIIETSGFGIFTDNEKLALIRKLADKRGIIILTDSDRAGFSIRSRLRGSIDSINIKHAYIPDVFGKERRKSTSSSEGKLGVEGMTPEVIIKSLQLAGATFEESETVVNEQRLITKVDLMSAGLSGCKSSAVKRRELQRQLELPERLSANGLLDVLNILFTPDEFHNFLQND